MGLIQRIQLLVDEQSKAKLAADMKDTGRKGAEGAAQEIQKATPAFNKAWGGIKAGLAGLAAGIVAAFSVRAITGFVSASIKAAAESERVWSATAAAVNGIGVAWVKVSSEVVAAATRIQQSSRFGDEEVAAGFTRLITLTGDYKLSLSALNPVVEFATRHNLSFEQAAGIVGKALGGNRTQLERLNPAMKGHKDVLAGITAIYGGSAAADMQTFGGQLDRLKNLWGDFGEILGSVFLEIGGGTGLLEALKNGVVAMMEWLVRNKGAIVDWVNLGLKVGIESVRLLWAVVVGATTPLRDLGLAIGVLTTESAQPGWVERMFGKDIFNLREMLIRTVVEIRQFTLAIQGYFEYVRGRMSGLTAVVAGVAGQISTIMATLWARIGAFLQSIPGMRGLGDWMIEQSGQARAEAGKWDAVRKQSLEQEEQSQAKSKALLADLKNANATVREEMASKTSASMAAQAKATADATGAMGGSFGDFEDEAGGAMSRTAAKGKEKVKELSDATKKHMAEMSAAYADTASVFDSRVVGGILAGKDRVLAAHKEMQKEQRLTTDQLMAANQAVSSAYIDVQVPAFLRGSKAVQEAVHAQRAAVEEVRAAWASGERTFSTETVPGILQGHQNIDRSIDETVRREQGLTEAFRGGEQYYVNQHVPAFLGGQEHMRKSIGETGDKTTAAAQTTKTTWLEAMGVLVNSFHNLSNVAGGVLGGLVNGVGTLVSGIAAASSGFSAFSNVTAGGLTGLIQKVAGLAGGFGGVVSVAVTLLPVLKSALGVVGDIVSGIGGVLGIKGSKDPGRYDTNTELYTAARAGDQTALDRLYVLSGRSGRAGAGAGGYEGWGTQAAMDDAWNKYRSAGGTKADMRGKVAGAPQPAAPRPTTTTPTTAPRPVTQQVSPSVPRFQTGGWMPRTGLAHLEAGELVLPPHMSREIAALVSQGSRGAAPVSNNSSEDNRSMTAIVNLQGIEDRDVPQRVVEAIGQAFGRDYQHQAALQGNVRVGR